MNERIRELALQAGDNIPEFHFGDYNIPNEFMEKFAELIVRECANKVKDFYQEDEFSCYNAAEEIKQHFGVE